MLLLFLFMLLLMFLCSSFHAVALVSMLLLLCSAPLLLFLQINILRSGAERSFTSMLLCFYASMLLCFYVFMFLCFYAFISAINSIRRRSFYVVIYESYVFIFFCCYHRTWINGGRSETFSSAHESSHQSLLRVLKLVV